MISTAYRLASLFAIIFFLSACGGGGGGVQTTTLPKVSLSS